MGVINLFIDSNIFLTFYHLTSENLVELEKLVALIDDEKLRLFLPEQVVDETTRNRSSKINDALSQFKNAKFDLSFPAYCKDYEHYSEIKESIKNSKRLHKEICAVIEKDIIEKKLKADVLLKNLFKAASIIKRSSEILDSSNLRRDLGNPPGKNNSLGDAINWESLLTIKGRQIDINIITNDADFYSPLDQNSFNEFLLIEWKKKKLGKLNAYRKLSDFFKENFPDIQLKNESEKNTLIKELILSPNFETTHKLISQLSVFLNFTQKQSELLAKALIENNQVNWILSDSDVLNFYEKIAHCAFLEFEDFYEEFEAMMKRARDRNIMEEIPF